MAINRLTPKTPHEVTSCGACEGSEGSSRGRSLRSASWVKHISVFLILVGLLITFRQFPTDRAVGFYLDVVF